MPLIEYRLRIRDAQNASDQLVLSSVRGDTYPHLVSPPDAEGNEFDPFTGQATAGALTFHAVDAITSGTDRVITARLEDAEFRQGLVDHVAIGEYRIDGGAWQAITSGAGHVVTMVLDPDNVTWHIGIGDLARAEEHFTAFAPRTGAVVLTADVALGATAMTVAPVPLAIVAGTALVFTGGGMSFDVPAHTTADVAAGVTSIPIISQGIPIAVNASANYTESLADYLARWPNRGCVIGGPILGGYMFSAETSSYRVPDLGGWTMEVDSQEASLGRAHLRPVTRGLYGQETLFVPSDNWDLLAGGVRDLLKDTRTGPFYKTQPQVFTVADAQGGPFPGLVIEVRQLDGTLVGYFSGAEADGYIDESGNRWFDGFAGVDEPLIVTGKHAGLFILKQSPFPVNGTKVRVRAFFAEPNELSPIWIDLHPLDLKDALWTEASIPHDAGTAAWAAARAAVGSDLYLAARIIDEPNLAQFLAGLDAAFGIGTRPDATGQLEPFSTRIANNPVPTRVLSDADVQTGSTTPYDLDASTAYREVSIALEQYTPLVIASSGAPTLHAMQVQQRTIDRTNADAFAVGFNTLSWELHGMPHHRGAWDPNALNGLLDGWIREVFDRAGRGPVALETTLLRGASGDGVLLGDEVLVNLPQLPNHNKRLGEDALIPARAMQAVQLTHGIAGDQAKLLDSGPNANAITTLPALAIALSLDNPRNIAELTITNAAALNAVGYGVRIAMCSSGGTAPAASAYVPTLFFAEGQIPTTAIRLPSVAAGRTVYATARSEQRGLRPSNYQTAVSVTLSTIAAPTSLAVTPSTTDASLAAVTWVTGAGAGDCLVEVYLRRSTDPAAQAILQDVLAPGSAAYALANLTPGASYTVGVRHRDPRSRDVSGMVEVTFTAGATTFTLAAPTDPYPFVGPQDVKYGMPRTAGLYGMAVTAADTADRIAFEEAIETALGSGTYGAFVEIARVDATPNGWTILYAVAPTDGLHRQLRARAVRDGATASAYTSVVTVLPWSDGVLLPDGTVLAHPRLKADGTFRTVKGIDAAAVNLTDDGHGSEDFRVYSGGRARVIAKGFQEGDAPDATVVLFAEPFAGVPFVDLQLRGGGLVNEPRTAQWSLGLNTAIPVYMDLQAQNPTAGGFTLRAKLRQKSTPTAQTANFTSPLTASTVGAHSGPATLSAGAPSSNDQYTCRARVSVTCITVTGQPTGTQVAKAILESNDGITGWQERYRATCIVSNALAGTTTQDFDLAATVSVTGLDPTDQFRWTLLSDVGTGGSAGRGSSSLTANNGSNNNGLPGVSYTTSPGDSFAAMTPDADDMIHWQALEVSS